VVVFLVAVLAPPEQPTMSDNAPITANATSEQPAFEFFCTVPPMLLLDRRSAGSRPGENLAERGVD
jgi:hypothetical protein